MLLCLKEAEYHTGRFGKDFEFGDLVRERSLEKSRVADFNNRFEKILPHIIELKSITKDESLSLAKDMFKQLANTKKEVVKLAKEADSKNTDLEVLSIHIDGVLKKRDEEKFKNEIPGLVSLAKEVESQNAKINGVVSRIEKVLFETDVEKLKNVLEITLNHVNALKVKNIELENVVKELHKTLDEAIYVMKNEVSLNDFVTNIEKQKFPKEIIEFIASKFVSTREMTIFEYEMFQGENLLTFKDKMKTSYQVHTYGTDYNIDDCRIAKEKGVDFVAKKGLLQVSHNTFDIAMCFNHQFSFYKPENRLGSFLPEEDKFNYTFQRAIPKQNGFYIFNVPFYKLGLFLKKIKTQLTVEGMYRVDDEMKNILFITKYKRDSKNNDPEFRRAMINYDKLPHYSEMKEFYINKGDVTHPKTFRPYFVDDEDILAAFEREKTTLEVLEEVYKPKEKVVELNRPLQEYKEGHRATRFCA
jgi:hypothetical protein